MSSVQSAFSIGAFFLSDCDLGVRLGCDPLLLKSSLFTTVQWSSTVVSVLLHLGHDLAHAWTQNTAPMHDARYEQVYFKYTSVTESSDSNSVVGGNSMQNCSTHQIQGWTQESPREASSFGRRGATLCISRHTTESIHRSVHNSSENLSNDDFGKLI